MYMYMYVTRNLLDCTIYIFPHSLCTVDLFIVEYKKSAIDLLGEITE